MLWLTLDIYCVLVLAWNIVNIIGYSWLFARHDGKNKKIYKLSSSSVYYN